MTKRISVKCSTCQQGIIFRVGIGGEKFQFFSIACPSCKQKIGLELKLNGFFRQEGIPIIHKDANVEKLINCTFEIESDEFIAINLHAELVYPKEFINEKVMIPSVIVSQQMLEHALKKGIINLNQKAPILLGKYPQVINIFDSLQGDSELKEDWQILKKAIELNSIKPALTEKELLKYSKRNDLAKNSKYLESIIFHFFSRLIKPNLKLYEDIENEFEKGRKLDNQEMKNFISYYKQNLMSLHIKNYLEIFNEYFENFKDFNRILLNNKIELHPSSGSESIICPIDFEQIKMYYGNAYEFFTSHIITLVCVNNILNSRKFDQFKTMTFNKYVKDVKKESKSTPLQNNVTFKNFTDFLDSTIRNASHHKWFYIDEQDIGFLNYKSGGTGQLNKISYIDYLYKCNEITIKLAVLFMIEIYLIEY